LGKGRVWPTAQRPAIKTLDRALFGWVLGLDPASADLTGVRGLGAGILTGNVQWALQCAAWWITDPIGFRSPRQA